MAAIVRRVGTVVFAVVLTFSNGAWADSGIDWNTFVGSSAYDYGRSVATDDQGNFYVIGKRHTTWGTPVRPLPGVNELVVAKFKPSGALMWLTALGAPNSAVYNALIATDSDGNVYVTGISKMTWGSPVNPHNAMGADVFVAKLDSAGSLRWNTFLGSTGIDHTDINRSTTVNQDGKIDRSGANDRHFKGSPIYPHKDGVDIFIARLDKKGILLWNTILSASRGSQWSR
jgi:hypothetical protein